MGVYGWDNRAVSMALGDCIANITFYDGKNRSGASRLVHNGLYTTLNFGIGNNWNSRVSSYQTDTTGPCL